MSEQRHRVWDAPTRVFHWAIVAIVLAQWCSAEWNLLSMDWHFRLGYAALALVLFRIAWGFVGSESARFSSFVRGPEAVARYLPQVFARQPDAFSGHNPLGGWSVLVLLALLLAQSITGLFATDDISLFGPLAERVSVDTAGAMTGWHKDLTDALVIMIGVHLLAVAWHGLFKREDLTRAMLTGDKTLPESPQLQFAGLGRAASVMAACAAIVWAIVTYGPA
jgi:cytochrome b